MHVHARVRNQAEVAQLRAKLHDVVRLQTLGLEEYGPGKAFAGQIRFRRIAHISRIDGDLMRIVAFEVSGIDFDEFDAAAGA